VRALEEWATTRLRADTDLELIVLGHTHQPHIRQVTSRQWYVNSGDWVLHRSYLTLEIGREPVLSEWTGERK
jgi:UDP-2,3-diacylglucosamine pyrophosphatase LpxH